MSTSHPETSGPSSPGHSGGKEIKMDLEEKKDRPLPPSTAATSTGSTPSTKADSPLDSMIPRSDTAGAIIRGLEDVTKALPGRFRYTNCLGREYDTKTANIRSVGFHISRLGDDSVRIRFTAPTTEAAAIESVEAYLSKPLTQEYYEEIMKDTFHQLPWEEAKTAYKCRGDVLTDAKFLERVHVNKAGHLCFSIGT